MEERYYLLSSEEVVRLFKSSNNGLTEDEAKKRLEKNGLNKLKETKKKGLLFKFLEQFNNIMIIILIISAILSAVVSYRTNEPFTDTIIILFVVFLNAVLGVIQESKAEKAIEALAKMSLPYIKVKRDGKVVSIKTEELVVGDIVLIEAGDYVPADMRIVENHSLRVEEAAITGESVAIDKQKGKIDDEKQIPLAERFNMLYSGSSVVYGRGEAVVTATGMNTELGKIANAISTDKETKTPLQKKMDDLSKKLSFLVIIIAIIMFVVGYVQGNQIIDVFMLAVSLAVAAIPEGLAAVITIILAIGVQKMAKQNAIVRKLSSVEALGSTEIICSDKTGTLTQNIMTVRKAYIGLKIYDVNKEKSDIEKVKGFDIFSKTYMLCNDTKFGEENGYKVKLGDPTETALITFGENFNFDKDKMEDEYKRVYEVPFDSNRKMMTTVNKNDTDYIVCTKGAVESVISRCTKININGKIKKITSEDKENIIKDNILMAKQALRVLAFAYKDVDNEYKNLSDDKLEEDLVFMGLIGMIDPPRKEALNAIKECFSAGMTPIMITGDNIDTAVAIAKELGIITDEKQAVTGSMVDEMSDKELLSRIKNIKVYARVSPENKIRIVKAWKSIGKIVAMTGDGVNDAPALKAADIGIGMGITGTEVSKSVSSMVLSDDNFATIVLAVKEGRRIYTNIQNVIVYLLASNLAEVLIIFIATLFNYTILLPIQILWINLISDTIPAIALGFEKEEKDIMKKKPRSSNGKFFDKYLVSKIVSFGVIKTIAVILFYNLVLNAYMIESFATTVSFITLSTIEILFAYACRSNSKSIFEMKLFSNIPMLLCVLGAMIIQLIIILVPVLSSWLQIVPLPTNLYISIAVISIAAILTLDIVKVFINKRLGTDK